MTGFWPPWVVMWTLAVVVYAACKGLTWWPARHDAAPAWRHSAYLVAWPGLDAHAFLTAGPARRPGSADWLRAGRNVSVGLGLYVWGARLVAPYSLLAAGWVGMIGLALSLHFGVFHAIACAWQRAGVEAQPVMQAPLGATSLAEFWGRRWNTAFRDLTHRHLFQPLTRRWGPRGGLAAGFAFSGLVHELVISVPAGGGYGGPTAFFVIQGLGILLERSRAGRRLGLGRGVAGWAFTMLAVLAPVPWLFHRPFVTRVVVPFMQATGAL